MNKNATATARHFNFSPKYPIVDNKNNQHSCCDEFDAVRCAKSRCGGLVDRPSGRAAQPPPERGSVTLVFDRSFAGESRGEVRNVASPEPFTEGVSAAVDHVGLLPEAEADCSCEHAWFEHPVPTAHAAVGVRRGGDEPADAAVLRAARDSVDSGGATTQFGRGVCELNIRRWCASARQAQGRVERAQCTMQDRLVNELLPDTPDSCAPSTVPLEVRECRASARQALGAGSQTRFPAHRFSPLPAQPVAGPWLL